MDVKWFAYGFLMAYLPGAPARWRRARDTRRRWRQTMERLQSWT